MAQILIRGLDNEAVERLKERARKNRRSLAAEVRTLLHEEVNRERRLSMKAAREFAEGIRRQMSGRDVGDSVELIREDRER